MPHPQPLTWLPSLTGEGPGERPHIALTHHEWELFCAKDTIQRK